MKTKFAVTDEDGNISWSKKAKSPEAFPTFAAAERRAKGLAELSPGRVICVYTLAAEVIVPTSAVKTTRV